ncbi:MAG: Arylsulfatase [Gammaproteobacteria bacterium]|jgi:arylsulfatase A-like enzyme|nr:Arylsulfatase [Gammaproteobacteria bacterium]
MRDLPASNGLLGTLVALTGLYLFTQILFFSAALLTSNALDTFQFILPSLSRTLLHSPFILFPIFQFFVAQILIYGFYVAIIWYFTISISELFSLRLVQVRLLGALLWMVGVVGILAANGYYFPEAFFSKLMSQYLFPERWMSLACKIILCCTITIAGFVIFLTLIQGSFNFYKKIYRVRDCLAFLFVIGIFSILATDHFLAMPTVFSSPSPNKPNIIMIGFDAMRPDFIGIQNKFKTETPHINDFMRSATQFVNAYTPLARTLPSWTSILTSRYPKNHHARGNNTDLSRINLDETLEKSLKQQGYETFYATDDRRYNNLNEQFGFDHVVGPPTGFNDFLLGSINDFPFSHLLIPTPLGKILFPYSYANHDVSISFSPDNFLQLIRQALHRRQNKPVFLAVHFNISGYPFYWVGCKKKKEDSMINLYKNGINEADKQFNELFTILRKNNLLQNAIVILLSDHGISLGLPHDRVIQEAQFQGDKRNLKKIKMTKYYNAPSYSTNKSDYGIDTSWGYGGDILSLKQNHILLAIKSYGKDRSKSPIIFDRVSTLDIAPTLLDILDYPPFKKSEGISLKNLMTHKKDKFTSQRVFYFETSFSIPEIETEHVSVENVLKKVIHLYEIDPKDGQVFFQPAAEHAMNYEKEHAIMKGEWYLACYPPSRVLKLTFPMRNKTNLAYPQKMFIKASIISGYKVLVNLQTGQWTMNWDTPLALHAPLVELLNKLQGFYNDEILS